MIVLVKARSIQSIDQIAPYAIKKCQTIDMTDVLELQIPVNVLALWRIAGYTILNNSIVSHK